jgi:hypothetical protein
MTSSTPPVQKQNHQLRACVYDWNIATAKVNLLAAAQSLLQLFIYFATLSDVNTKRVWVPAIMVLKIGSHWAASALVRGA